MLPTWATVVAASCSREAPNFCPKFRRPWPGPAANWIANQGSIFCTQCLWLRTGGKRNLGWRTGELLCKSKEKVSGPGTAQDAGARSSICHQDKDTRRAKRIKKKLCCMHDTPGFLLMLLAQHKFKTQLLQPAELFAARIAPTKTICASLAPPAAAQAPP